MRQFKFEKLIIWQKAMDLGEKIDLIQKTFPKQELFSLCSQFLRAGDSVALNISEGSIGQSNAEQKRFIGYSIRSLAEVVTCLFKAKRRKYITKEKFVELHNFCYELMNMLYGFKTSLK